MASEYRLWKMTWEEVENAVPLTDAVILPVGSIEQHGRHMPVDVDTFTSQTFAEKTAQAAEKSGLKVLVAPPLHFGVSWYHMDFPGTIAISQTTFITVVMEILRCLRKHGFKNLILVNSHGGNIPALSVILNLFYEETGQMVYLAQWWELGNDVLREYNTGYIHAEEAETSLELYLGQIVHMDKATKDAFNRGEALRQSGKPYSRWIRYDGLHKGPWVTIPMNRIAEISKSGVVGDATLATREKGQKLAEAFIERLVQVCGELAGKK